MDDRVAARRRELWSVMCAERRRRGPRGRFSQHDELPWEREPDLFPYELPRRWRDLPPGWR